MSHSLLLSRQLLLPSEKFLKIFFLIFHEKLFFYVDQLKIICISAHSKQITKHKSNHFSHWFTAALALTSVRLTGKLETGGARIALACFAPLQPHHVVVAAAAELCFWKYRRKNEFEHQEQGYTSRIGRLALSRFTCEILFIMHHYICERVLRKNLLHDMEVGQSAAFFWRINLEKKMFCKSFQRIWFKKKSVA